MNKKDESTYTLKSNNNKNVDSIPCRLEFIKDLMKDKIINPLIEVDNSESGDSYDTRHELKKKTLDFATIIDSIGGRLDYIKSGTTGHTFHGISGNDLNNPDYDYAVKVSAFQKKAKYGDMYDIRRPENAEIKMIKLLSKLIIKKQTPHIVLPICTFDTNIDNFVHLMDEGYIEKDNKKYKDFVSKYKKGDYYNNVSILISEWANKGDFLDYVRKNYKTFSPMHWKVFFFQIISVLAVIQSRYPSFRHNDMKANNVLIHKIKKKNKSFNYRVVRSSYKVPNIGYQIKIWDFDFACIPGIVENQKVNKPWTKAINVTPDSNKYYDLHYFFNTFIKKGFFPQFLKEDYIPQKAKEFVMRIVPKKYQKGKFVHERGRILINHEYTTPDEILKNDEYFQEFRIKHNKSDTNVEYIKKSDSKDNLKNILKGGRRRKQKSKNKKIRKKKRLSKKSKSKSKSKLK